MTKATDTITTQTMSTAACPGLSNCDLVPVFLDNTFANLTELRINVTVAGIEKIWWLDDLNLSWFDDSCDAGLCRQEHILMSACLRHTSWKEHTWYQASNYVKVRSVSGYACIDFIRTASTFALARLERHDWFALLDMNLAGYMPC
jgi:hypothetical protein